MIGLIGGLLAVSLLSTSVGAPHVVGVVSGCLLVSVAIAVTWLGVRTGTVVTNGGLVLRGLRNREVPWRDVQEIWLDRDGSALNWAVLRLRTRRGRVHILPGAAAWTAERRDELAGVVDDLNRLRARAAAA